ncbi:MAG TPA: glycoside hydrolase family 57 protein [Candidatus Angelobacter sp.]
MPSIRLLFLWHMHQPYYKDLVTGEYRLPWVRLHALKDYYGMVKLLDEFPQIHQTFNLTPCLVAQIQDYVNGTARDPFFEVVAKPASTFSHGEKEFALEYLFQGNLQNMVGRYPRYRELWDKVQGLSTAPGRAALLLQESDFTDLQVLSQVAWMDEFWLEDPEVRELIKKGHGYSQDDREWVVNKQKEFLARVLPSYKEAQDRGSIEISTSPFYHPILPLICDTDVGAVSHLGLPLPAQRFRHPEDAREQIVGGLNLHEQVFGMRPRGMWPSEGSVSNEVLAIAHQSGIDWMATDEGVLGRSLSTWMERDGAGNLNQRSATELYRICRWEQDGARMHMVFRDHSLSDLIGFVYSGMPAKDAAEDFIRRIKAGSAPLLAQGQDAVVSIILDGENAWEYYPRSGREFLRRLYDGIQNDKLFETLTVSEAVAREPRPEKLTYIVPGSWINANFDIWIGAPEDNQAWDHLSAARDFFGANAERVSAAQKQLAFEELLIAEGSDWNWWYGPEHHSANDRDFDELYRKHLANVYQALGAEPPEVLARPIIGSYAKALFSPQSAYISPRLDSVSTGYFDWLGAAVHVADRRSSAMHGKHFLLDTGYAGIDKDNLYCRLDLMEKTSEWAGKDTRLVATITSHPALGDGASRERTYRLEAFVDAASISEWTLRENGYEPQKPTGAIVALRKESVFECRVPLASVNATRGMLLQVRFALFHGLTPLEILPREGSIELQVVPEEDLSSVAYAKP